MSATELYTKGAQVWIPHTEKVWEAAELLEDYSPSKASLSVLSVSNETKVLTIKSENDLPFLMNPRILLGENDLTALSYLHEPAVLNNLQYRFCQKNYIYTYCGIVLVAINPYTELPIYDIDTIQTYRGQSLGNLDPHVFAVAEEAFTKLEREQRDQSIIVSGESGAGKTVSAKYTMRYFATVGGSTTETQVEKKVLASSPIMEAIGNAKTTRNDNSSRFGKFIELQFNKQFHIIGASMRTYLLEKSRVVFQAPEERNYHIFYQLCAAAKKLPHLQLDNQNKFHYLNQGKSPTVSGVDDFREFEETVKALNLLGFSEKEQDDLFRIIASIIHIGNIKFSDCIIQVENEQDQEGCAIKQNDKHLKMVSNLLEINEEEMRQWLCTRKLISMRDIFLKPMSIQDATTARDALAKHIYSALFNWVVMMINRTLESEMQRHRFIGVLDIYGFETFEINSFEQFCINYANEKLQQQFNLHVFKLEQEEYIREGIEWKMIEFYDNQPCIDLIEAKLGILDLLDEECKMPRGTDSSWTEKLYGKCSRYPHFSKPRFGTTAFIVNHFADKVQYESDGFLEKNKDTVIEEQINVIRCSTNELVRKLFSPETQKLAPPRTKLKVVSAKPMPNTQKTHKQSVCSQFRDSLNKLMSTLNATTPHYVRCIKPNDSKSAFEYEPKRAVQQLRACGVLETIRLSSAGFPSRWTYIDFFYRYRVFCKTKDIMKTDMKKTCEVILKKCIKDSSTYQFGKTMIFFRAGQVAYLEKLRADKLKACCIMMQKSVRMFICRKKYLRIQKSAALIQRYGRGVIVRRLAQEIRRTRASITIQKYVRGWLKRIQYQRLRQSILGIQTRARGYMARLRFLRLKQNAAAIIIQKHIRGWLARRWYKQTLRKIVICQSAVRRYLARKQYKKLKIEARSIEHVKTLNKGLENKIISLQQRIEDLNKTNSELRGYQNEVHDLKLKLQSFKSKELEIKNLSNLLTEKNKLIEKLETDIKIERDEKMDLINEQDRIKQDIANQQKLWAQETAKLREELENMNEIVRANEKGAEENLKVRLEEEKLLIINETDSDRGAYQRLLNEYHNLEQYCEELKSQIRAQGHQGLHKRNISDLSSISAIDEVMLTTDVPEDFGYGSVRSTVSNSSARERLEDVNWKVEATSENHTPTTLSISETTTNQEVEPSTEQQNINVEPTTDSPNTDVSLVIRLQHKLSTSERERLRIQKRLDELDLSPKVEKAKTEAEYFARISEMELINSQLNEQLMELQNSIKEGNGLQQLHKQLATAQNELQRRSEEIIQLKSVLAEQTNNMKTILNSKSHTGEYINEDGELAQAYETQKTINKQLELEIQDEKAKYLAYEKELKLEIEKLQEDNDRQQRILSANLLGSGQTQEIAFMQFEINRLTSENLDLRDRIDSINENLRKFKKREKLFLKKLRDAGFDLAADTHIDTNGAVIMRGNEPSIRKKDRAYLGMFSFKEGDENNIMKQLLNIKPRTAVTLLPGLPAYIIFMCVRYTDYINDEEKVKVLLSSFSNSLKKIIRKRLGDFETSALWLSNVLRLIYTMKQYSGEKAFQVSNTPKQNDQCLRNFDLSEYRQVFTDHALWIYQGVVKNIRDKIQSLIVPAILEHEEIPGISGNKPSGSRSRLGSSSGISSPTGSQKPTTLLLQELTNHHKILCYYGVDTGIVSQIFQQIYYFMCATSLNNLLLRKELCHWSKGLQIRHNLSHLEMWTREKNLDEPAIQSKLQPIIQAAQLLQARKSEEDVESICDMCSALTPPQICKILNLYTPVDEFEKRVPSDFIKQVHAKLQERPDNSEHVLLDVNHNYTVRIAFNPSDICLEDIDIPESINLPMLVKL